MPQKLRANVRNFHLKMQIWKVFEYVVKNWKYIKNFIQSEIGDLLCQGEFQDWWIEGKGLEGSGVVEFKRVGGGEALGWDPIPKFDEPKGLKLLFNPNGLIWLKP